jgi:hypothetical protein
MDAALALGRQAILGKQEDHAAAAAGSKSSTSSNIQRHYSEELASAESMLALSKSPPRKIKDSSSSHEEADKRGNATTALPICEKVIIDNESSVRRAVVDESNPTITVSTPSRPIMEPRLSSGKKRKERIAMPQLLPSDEMILSQTFKRQRNAEESSSDSTSD